MPDWTTSRRLASGTLVWPGDIDLTDRRPAAVSRPALATTSTDRSEAGATKPRPGRGAASPD
jgi:hypothetical protein